MRQKSRRHVLPSWWRLSPCPIQNPFSSYHTAEPYILERVLFCGIGRRQRIMHITECSATTRHRDTLVLMPTSSNHMAMLHTTIMLEQTAGRMYGCGANRTSMGQIDQTKSHNNSCGVPSPSFATEWRVLLHPSYLWRIIKAPVCDRCPPKRNTDSTFPERRRFPSLTLGRIERFPLAAPRAST